MHDLALIQETLCDIEGARERYLEAVRLAPDFDEAREALEQPERGFEIHICVGDRNALSSICGRPTEQWRLVRYDID